MTGFTGDPSRPSFGDYVGGDVAPDPTTQQTVADLYRLAAGAGIPKDQQRVAVAIALAESNGNPSAHNPNPPDDSYGLWQINMLGSLGPDRRSKLGLSSNTDLYSPDINAKAMALLSSGGKDWSPWSTFKSGAYERYLPQADLINADPGAAVALGGGPVDVFTGPGGIGSMIKSPLDALKLLTAGSTWLRVLEVVGGVALIGFALVRLASKTDTAQAVVKAAV